MICGWKVFTSGKALSSPGAPSLWDGPMPVQLPVGPSGTARTWTFHLDLPSALRASSLWPSGRPSIAVRVTASAAGQGIGCLTASRLRLVSEAHAGEISEAVQQLSQIFGEYHEEMVAEQLAWRAALARPEWSVGTIEDGLGAALDARGLDGWSLRRYESPNLVWSQWCGWGAEAPDEAMAARENWGTRLAFAARGRWFAIRPAESSEWKTWGPGATPGFEQRVDCHSPAFAASLMQARAAFAADFALSVRLASLRRWIPEPKETLTVGIRDAYAHGLEVALPVAPRTLGWAAAERSGSTS
jgi:hypothetical protein